VTVHVFCAFGKSGRRRKKQVHNFFMSSGYCLLMLVISAAQGIEKQTSSRYIIRQLADNTLTDSVVRYS